MPKIRMVVNTIGHKAGDELEVSKETAERLIGNHQAISAADAKKADKAAEQG